MTLINNEIHLNSIDKNIVAAQKLVKQYCENNNLVDELFQMRKEETKQEAQKQNITENQIPTGK